MADPKSVAILEESLRLEEDGYVIPQGRISKWIFRNADKSDPETQKAMSLISSLGVMWPIANVVARYGFKGKRERRGPFRVARRGDMEILTRDVASNHTDRPQEEAQLLPLWIIRHEDKILRGRDAISLENALIGLGIKKTFAGKWAF